VKKKFGGGIFLGGGGALSIFDFSEQNLKNFLVGGIFV